MIDDEELEKIRKKKLEALKRRLKMAGKVVEIHNKDEFEEIVKNEPVVFVDFYADWCMPCKIMVPIIEDLAKEYAGRVTFLKVNVDKNRELAYEFSIMSIPSFYIFKDSKLVERLVGALPKNKIKEVLERIIK